MHRITPVRVTIALCFFIAIALLAFRFAPRKTRATVAREARQAPVIDVAPATLSDTATVLAGTEGTDADGYPTQYVDKVVLRGFLFRARYEDLTKAFEQFQDAAEKDDRHEYWIMDAGDAFSTADPALKEKLDAWVAASSGSFGAYLARGVYLTRVGFARRGVKWAKDTPKEDFDAMRQAFAPATDDLAKALSIRPKLVAAKRAQMQIASSIESRRRVQEIADEATNVCPGCFQIRVAYLLSSVPRWGGSFQEMETYIKNVSVAPNPRLRLLPGYVDFERAIIAREAKDEKGALVAIERACALGDGADFFNERGIIHGALKDWTAAKQDFDRAIAIRPEVPEYLAERANAELDSKSFEASANDLLMALRIDPTDEYARAFHEASVNGLIYKAWEAQQRGDKAEALRLYDLGGELAPANHDLQSRRAWLLAGGPDAGIPSPAAAASMAANIPDDIDEVRKMDYALSRARRFNEILPLWNAYIAKHPDDGRAYLERSGTYFNLGKAEQAGGDARKACDLGFNEGCLHARQLGK